MLPVIQSLNRTSPWMRVCAIATAVYAVASIVSSIVDLARLRQLEDFAGEAMRIMAPAIGVGILVTVIYLFLAAKMWSYHVACRDLESDAGSRGIAEALRANRVLLKFSGILAIVAIGLILLGVAIAFVGISTMESTL